jgi:hypothetical protein
MTYNIKKLTEKFEALSGGVPAVISGVAGLMKDAAAGDMTAAAEGKR